MRLNIIAATCALALLTGCACPDIVNTREIGDEQMSCEQLAQEIEKCKNAKKELDDEKGFTGKNTAAALFFWPALIATHSNVNDALKALNDRQDHLVNLHAKKCCPQETTK
ncbi:MAG: hypothetical protein LCH26_07010 [Proteobacteria bacterium]|nr:hypothetical protein [Pseudomonadota bacterium]